VLETKFFLYLFSVFLIFSYMYR